MIKSNMNYENKDHFKHWVKVNILNILSKWKPFATNITKIRIKKSLNHY